MTSLPEMGALCLAGALAAALYATVAALAGAYWQVAELAESGRRALVATALLTTIAVLVLVHRFLVHDFALRYVWLYSDRATSWPYRVAALWGGQAGSLLFWCWLLAGQAALAVRRPWPAIHPLVPWLVAILGGVLCFFLGLTLLAANPFERLAIPAADGNGLNPLLRHPGMALHPPALYLGFTGMAIPYGLAMSALLSRRRDSLWLHAARRWSLYAWLALTVGLVLGGRWAYDVLGWGGYWGWDPVENAGLLPWLAATAWLHSAIVQTRRGLFQLWNLALVSLAFWLVVLGTFLTRGGLVTSVHSFAQSETGPSFLAFTALTMLGTLALLWRRLPELETGRSAVSALSRESAFLVNNLLFMAALFGVLWGTLFPILVELAGGQRVTVGAPYFVAVVVPILWLLVAWMAVGPLTTWSRVTVRGLLRSARRPLAMSGATLVALALLWRDAVALVAAAAAVLALWVAVAELARRLRVAAGRSAARGQPPLRRRLGWHHRAVGAHLVHLGVALLAVGIVGSNRFDRVVEAELEPGQSAILGEYRFAYSGRREVQAPDRTAMVAPLEVWLADRPIGRLEPRREWFRGQEDQPLTVPAILHRLTGDVVVTVSSSDAESQRLAVRLRLVPLVPLLWLGVVGMVLGGAVAVWPDRPERRLLALERTATASPASERGAG